MNTLLKDAIEGLIALHICNGVQPSDLADAMFETPYTDYKITKTSETLSVELSFLDDCDIETNSIKMKYTYRLDKKLQRIEQKVGAKKFALQWCRNKATSEAIKIIEHALVSMGADSKKISQIMSTLPPDVRSLVRARLSLAA